MQSSRLRLSIIAFALLLAAAGYISPAAGQDMQSSPTTRYGYGIPAYVGPVAWRGMGGVGLAMRNPKVINFANPAAFASTDSLSFLFDAAASLHADFYRDATAQRPSLQGGLDYIAAQFPIFGDRVGVSLGVVPSFYTGYGMSATETVEGELEGVTYQQSFTGAGSYQTAYLGFGVEALRDLYLGVSAKYLFGSTTHSWTRVPNYSQLTQSLEQHQIRLSEADVEVGLQYHLQMPGKRGQQESDRDYLSVGATYSPRLGIKPKATVIINRNLNSQTRPDIDNRTLTLETAMPHRIGLGIAWTRPRTFAVSADLRTALWHDVPNIFVNDGLELVDSYTAAIGFQRLSDPYSGSYGRQMTFSAGINYSTSYFDLPILGTMKYVGASVGFGFPVMLYGLERNSMLNLSLEYRHVIAAKESGFGSDMLRLTLGFTFNETWFRKLKIY